MWNHGTAGVATFIIFVFRDGISAQEKDISSRSKSVVSWSNDASCYFGIKRFLMLLQSSFFPSCQHLALKNRYNE